MAVAWETADGRHQQMKKGGSRRDHGLGCLTTSSLKDLQQSGEDIEALIINITKRPSIESGSPVISWGALRPWNTLEQRSSRAADGEDDTASQILDPSTRLVAYTDGGT